MIDYEYMALSLANLSGIPVRLYRDGKFAGLFHSSKFKPDLAISEEANIFRNPANVSYYMTEEFLFYGLFRVKEEPVCMVLGPVAQVPISSASARRILLSIGESSSRAADLQNYLRSIPGYSLRNFLQILCTFDYFLNGEKLSVGDILTNETILPEPAPVTELGTSTEDIPSGHNTYDLEQTMLSCIEHGRPEELKKYYQTPATGKAGKMAQDTLRQQKNLVIVTATLASRAAIRGGLDVETAFVLSDLYIQEAELMNQYEKLVRLPIRMTMEYARRVAALQCGDTNRKLIRDARQYILEHINEKITTGQLAGALNKNRTYLCACFKEETGLSVNAYITRIKIDEAKRLLKVSQKSLREIAEYLGYSSQSYFQNIFRKTEGITPLQYRLSQQ